MKIFAYHFIVSFVNSLEWIVVIIRSMPLEVWKKWPKNVSPHEARQENERRLKRIYLDYQATTPLDPRVLERMMPYLTGNFGNAASTAHDYGAAAAEAVAESRRTLAHRIGGDPLGLVFTSGATESINLALKGLADQYGGNKRHLITCRTEHPAVLDCAAYLENRGFRVTYLAVDRDGHLDLNALAEAVRADTLAISLMYANNETGVFHPVEAIGRLAKERGVFFHCDGAQAVGKARIDVEEMGIDLLSISAHKMYGPKGVGALYLRRKNPRVRLAPQIHGGGHERGFRSGTLNVPGIVGMAEALRLADDEREQENRRLVNLRNELLAGLRAAGATFHINGDPDRRLAGNLNLRFPGISAAALLKALPELALSRGSACSSAVPSPSPVLLAMGLTAEQAGQSLRIGLGRFTTAADIRLAGELFQRALNELRNQINPNEETSSCML